jgi:hypothetical protein
MVVLWLFAKHQPQMCHANGKERRGLMRYAQKYELGAKNIWQAVKLNFTVGGKNDEKEKE